MLCPTCQATMRTKTVGDQTVQQCDSCHGIWVKQAQLGAVIHAAVSGSDVSFPSETETRDVPSNCPACHHMLRTNHYAHNSGIMLHKCVHCSGTWLLAGQLQQLVSYQACSHSRDDLAAAMAAEMARRSRVSILRRLLQLRVASGMVAALTILSVYLLHQDIATAAGFAVATLFPLTCIWYADYVGNLQGVTFGFRGQIYGETPTLFVLIGGWTLLVAIAFAAVVRSI